MAVFGWHEIRDVPPGAGVYAWYYTPEITTFDMEAVVADVQALTARQDFAGAKSALATFLEQNVFRYFQEQPFSAHLKGPLKPNYEGRIDHKPTLSDSLLDRLVEDPQRLSTLREVLASSAPNFASPIYIGMSERLRTRLGQHKLLIERYSEMQNVGSDPENQRDQSFAREIRTRDIPPTSLFVAVKTVTGPPGSYVDIENVLNRIHYPLLGRN